MKFISANVIGIGIISISQPSQAAIINQDYIISFDQSDYTPIWGTEYRASKNVDESPWIDLRPGDTLTGIIRFSNNFAFKSEGRGGVTATFIYSDDRRTYGSYAAHSKTSLVNSQNQGFTFYQKFATSDNSPFIYVSNSETIYFDSVRNTDIAGLKFSLNFVGISDTKRSSPTRIRLGAFNVFGIPKSAAPVPEPSTWAMMMLGMAGIGLTMRRHRTTAKVTLA